MRSSSTADEIDKLEQIRRAGLYFGPVILAAFLANALYEMECHATRFSLGPGVVQPVLIAPFLVFSLFLAWRFKEPLGRAALVMFALQEAIFGYAALFRTAPNGLVLGSLLIAFLTLFTASGARGAPPRRLALASCVFVAAFLFSWSLHYYANGVMGRHSVLSGPMCSIAVERSNGSLTS